MTILYSNFEEFQSQYQTSYISEKIYDGLLYLKSGVQKSVSFIDEANQIPELTRKIIQLSVSILSLIPNLTQNLEAANRLCKEARNFTNFFKGFKSINSLLNFKLSWRALPLTVSGMTLFSIDTLTLIDKYKIADITTLKMVLATIPIIGILPFGGLLAVSTAGMMSMLFLFALDKKSKLEKDEKELITDKLNFWSQSFDESTLEVIKKKCEEKRTHLQEDLSVYDQFLHAGMKLESELTEQNKKITSCRKAIQTLEVIIENKKEHLTRIQNKYTLWTQIEKQFDSLNPQEIDNFRKAKLEKWQANLNKIHAEKKANAFFMVNNVSVALKQLLIITRAFRGHKILPSTFGLCFEIVETSCGITTFFMKRSISKMEIPTADAEQYISFDALYN